MLYREFETQDQLDAQYNVGERNDDSDAYADFYVEESRKARADLDVHRDVSFGPTVPERLDVFPAAESNAPVLLFIHGGYWHSRHAEDFSFVARGPVSEGVTTVVMNYALCPAVPFSEVVRQARAALVWTHENIAAYGGDPDRLFVSGHSAGGHLTGCLLTTDWEDDYGKPADVVEGACAISGLYDLDPFPYTWLQPKLQLTWREVRDHSPIRHIPDSAPPLVVTYGENEPAELRRQSEDFLAAWRDHGLDGRSLPQPEADHYSAIEGFLDPESRLCAGILDLIEE